ncbi:hypothetical protein P5G51_017825 [Virgibacillus sp. 179-BFC.A HS]|uniref:DUF3784 domain-containing protein n=1 Tax=Tigheibacillus jepli TaxID=3035914 RepID=A0ABU5CKV4_9BACI|nr:hypothetical protein [Virgibacillus sp. 179-BFC.A HS]MDY0406950.1 hypothetical protein [Virgibacillus sp. 179-BFC.A HS]
MLTDITEKILSLGLLPNIIVFFLIGGMLVALGFKMWRNKKVLPLNSFEKEWSSVNEKKLSTRMAVTFIILGIVVCALPICFFWIGPIVGNVIAVVIIILVAFLILSFFLDKFGI